MKKNPGQGKVTGKEGLYVHESSCIFQSRRSSSSSSPKSQSGSLSVSNTSTPSHTPGMSHLLSFLTNFPLSHVPTGLGAMAQPLHN